VLGKLWFLRVLDCLHEEKGKKEEKGKTLLKRGGVLSNEIRNGVTQTKGVIHGLGPPRCTFGARIPKILEKVKGESGEWEGDWGLNAKRLEHDPGKERSSLRAIYYRRAS